MRKKTITAEQVRTHLLERIDSYQAKFPVTDSKLGTEALGDHKVVDRIRRGENFTIKTYQRIIDWLDGQRAAA